MNRWLGKDSLWGLVAVLLIITALITLYSRNNTPTQYRNFYATFTDISGIKVGSKVTLSGLPVGLVDSIELTPSLKAQIKLSIHQKWDIPDDSDLRIQSAGIFAQPYLALSLGGSFDLLEDGDEIEYTQSSIDFLKIFRQLVEKPAQQEGS